MNEDVCARRERGRVPSDANVAAQLLDRALELGLVERREVERAHLVPVGEQPPREVQPEKPGPSGDRPAHPRPYPAGG